MYSIAIAMLMIVSIYGSWKGRSRAALLSLFIIFSLAVLMAAGHDDEHHTARTIILADQVRSANLNLLFDNQAHGEFLPIFLYYSMIPYLPAVILNLVGIPAGLAFKMTLIGYLGLFMLGLWRLVVSQEKTDRHSGLLAIIVLVGANYVVGLWLARSAMAEILAYSLVPWVTLALVRSPSSSVSVFLLISLQAAIHPIVMLHSLLAEFVGAWALSRTKFIDLIKSNLLPLLLSLLVSSPFWLPAVLWRGAILGPEALPIKFQDTFLDLRQLIDPRSWKSPGLLLFFVAFLAAQRLANKRQVILLFLFVFTLFIQTVYGKFIGVHLPLVESSIFIWRLLFVTCFFGFVLFILSSNNMSLNLKRLLAIFAIVIVSVAAIRCGSGKPGYSLNVHQNRAELKGYLKKTRSWGVAEYFPNYRDLPNACRVGDQTVVRSEFGPLVNQGFYLDGAIGQKFMAVEKAPWGFVSYSFNGAKAPSLGACEGSLIFGPFSTSGRFKAELASLYAVSWLRLTVVVVALAWGLFSLFQRMRWRH